MDYCAFWTKKSTIARIELMITGTIKIKSIRSGRIYGQADWRIRWLWLSSLHICFSSGLLMRRNWTMRGWMRSWGQKERLWWTGADPDGWAREQGRLPERVRWDSVWTYDPEDRKAWPRGCDGCIFEFHLWEKNVSVVLFSMLTIRFIVALILT